MTIKNKKTNVGIFGGSGYGGSELLRILLFHPNVEISFVTANENAGRLVSSVHRNLRGLTELAFIDTPEDPATFQNIDTVFLALPHGKALNIVPKLDPSIKVIDLSGDFRIDDGEMFKKFYQVEQTAPEVQERFVYGLTETNRPMVENAQYIANPGCFATATLLALAPLAASGQIEGKVVVDGKTGSSGSGVKPAANNHHPQRMNSFYAYKPFTHQHVPEIEQHLRQLADFSNDLVFMTHSLPVSRGIFASCYLETVKEMSTDELNDIYKKYYGDSFFIRIVDGSPDINWVKNTNFCDIAIHSNGKQVVIFSAIDNLVKGAAGQAVQNMNLMFGLDESIGLIFPGSNP